MLSKRESYPGSILKKLLSYDRILVSLISLFGVLAFVLLVLVRYDWDAMAFVMEGTRFRQGVPDGSWGYDGQFAYYIALDPLNAPAWMDHDAYRYQRILYPALVWVFSLGGQPALIPWVMIAINLVCIFSAVYLLSGFLQHRELSAWVTLSFVFFAGIFMALRGNLLEPLAILLSMLGLLFSYRGKWLWAGVAFALAVLAKEMALAFPLGVVAWLFLRQPPPFYMSLRGSAATEAISPPRHFEDRQQLKQSPPNDLSLPEAPATKQSPHDDMSLRGVPVTKQSPPFTLTDLTHRYRTPILLLLGGLLPAIAWGITLTLWLGHSPLSAPFASMEKLPFYGLRYVDMSPSMGIILIWVAFPTFVFGLLGLLDVRRWVASPEALILLANVALIAFMPRLTWYNVGGALRVAIGLVVASLLYVAVFRPKLMPWVFAFWITSGLLVIPALIYAVD
jgi:hypothetical protein